MELNDVVYLILMFVFVVFGIFNDSKKKKKKINTSTEPINKDEVDVRELFRELFQKPEGAKAPPPIPAEVDTKSKNKSHEKRIHKFPRLAGGFESSMSFVTDFEKESSLKGYKFTDYTFESSDLSEKSIKEDAYIISDLFDGDMRFDVRKAIIYSEIINKKY